MNSCYLKILGKREILAGNWYSQSHWPRGLRLWHLAARLLGLRVRIPLGSWMFVPCERCVLSEVSASGWSLVQRSPTNYVVSKCDREVSIMRSLHIRACCATDMKNHVLSLRQMWSCPLKAMRAHGRRVRPIAPLVLHSRPDGGEWSATRFTPEERTSRY
jgi:hypothetical protein